MPIAEFLEECKAATFSDAGLTWIPSSRLLAVAPLRGWACRCGSATRRWRRHQRRGQRAPSPPGLALRPVIETIRDTLAWDIARGGPDPGKEGLTAEEEQCLLAA